MELLSRAELMLQIGGENIKNHLYFSKHHSGARCLLSGKEGSLHSPPDLHLCSGVSRVWGLKCVGQEGPEPCAGMGMGNGTAQLRAVQIKCRGFAKDNKFFMLSRRGHWYCRCL